MATYECDPELLPKPQKTVEAPAEPAPAPVATTYGEPEKVSLSADQLFDFDKANLKPEGKQVWMTLSPSLKVSNTTRSL